MIVFLIGMFVGGSVGYVTAALVSASKDKNKRGKKL